MSSLASRGVVVSRLLPRLLRCTVTRNIVTLQPLLKAANRPIGGSRLAHLTTSASPVLLNPLSTFRWLSAAASQVQEEMSEAVEAPRSSAWQEVREGRRSRRKQEEAGEV